MELELKSENGNLLVKVIGRLDTITSQKLEEELSNNIDGVNSVTFDFEKLNYISSSGIRILLTTRKKIENMKVLNPTKEVMEVFEITGLSEIFNIQK